ncbi:hypothetical protein [Fodinicola acaciae]|uniref:hypothetical protein n=1 Tax=Fodinicola acaciae TaxID=2681555 RepID=UPI0013D28FC2|nr:hypothetical protein [Fodinicola acaciae]
MTEPALRASTSSGKTWDDPSEELILQLLDDMDSGEEYFVIIDRLATPQTYVQVGFAPTGEYQVEYRDGGPDRHFQAVASDKRLVHDVMTRWAFDRPGWQDLLPWQPLFLSN